MDARIGALDTGKPLNNDVSSLPTNGAVTIHQSPILFNSVDSILGRRLAHRLVQVGVNDVFSVPGNFNLTLLDHLLAEPGLNLVGCCNELNAGKVADGYARSGGVGLLQKTGIFLTGLVGSAMIFGPLVMIILIQYDLSPRLWHLYFFSFNDANPKF